MSIHSNSSASSEQYGLSAIGHILRLCHGGKSHHPNKYRRCRDTDRDRQTDTDTDTVTDTECSMFLIHSGDSSSIESTNTHEQKNHNQRQSASSFWNKHTHCTEVLQCYGPICMLVSTCLAFELSSVLIMTIISKFYLAITSQDLSAFLSCLWRATWIITIVSICQSLKTFAVDYTALQWRSRLVTTLHTYLNANPPWTLQVATHLVENIDQRTTQDIYRLTLKLATLFSTVLTLPAIILFYSYYLTSLFGFLPPLACLGYFLIGAVFTRWQAQKIIPLVYQQEAQEGYFRARHMQYKQHQEKILFLNGNKTEVHVLQRTYDALKRSVLRLLYTQLPLNLMVNWFSYFGSIGEVHVTHYDLIMPNHLYLCGYVNY